MNRNHLSRVGKPARTLTPTRPLGPRRILVVDDDIHIRRLNKSALSNFGYQVDARDGASHRRHGRLAVRGAKCFRLKPGRLPPTARTNPLAKTFPENLCGDCGVFAHA